MFSTILLFFLALYAWQQRNLYIAALLLPPIFFFALAYELNDTSLTFEYFDFAKVENYDVYVAFGIFQLISVILALSARISGRVSYAYAPNLPPSILVSRAKFIYYFLASLASLAFVVNLNNVGFDLSLLFVLPRVYEEAFGKSTFVNYLYFLNVPALCLSVYLRQQKNRAPFANTIDAILVSMSLFHGIKFTVFDTLLLPSFFYFHCSRQPRRALLLLCQMVFILLCFYLAFSLLVRGFTEDEGAIFKSVLNYILPNYYNLAYSFQLNPWQFDPLSFLLPDKFPNPFIGILMPGEFGFLLNEKFNMATAYTVVYASFPPISWVFFTPLLVKWRNWVVHRTRYSQRLDLVFFSAYIDFCLFFFWYFYAFNKTKYVYYLVVMLFVACLIHKSAARTSVNRKVIEI